MATLTPSYAGLLQEVLPSQIETRDQYTGQHARLSALIRKGRARNTDETKLMRLLSVLIEDYDRRNGLPPSDATPTERLQFLLDHSGKTRADLESVFGQRSHVSEALSGRRQISVVQAQKLGKLFAVKPGLFI